MRIVIIEDEWAAQEQLKLMLKEIVTDIEVVEIIVSVKEAITFFKTAPQLDLIFMDIHLSDGSSLDIFNHVDILVPIIFTTAYDQYAIQAFKHNSIDYLLKPIVVNDLRAAIDKYKSTLSSYSNVLIQSIYKEINSSKVSTYKNSFLIQKKDRLYPIDVDNIAAFFIEDTVIKFFTFDKQKHSITHSLDELERMLNPSLFFRVSRQYIIHRKAIGHLSIFFNGKLKLHCNLPFADSIVVSRLKSNELKLWLSD